MSALARPSGLEFDELDEPHFEALARLIETHAGIRLPPSKRTMVEGRLRRRVRALGMRSLGEYGTAIFEKGLLSREFAHVIDCVTTNKTDFFREPQQFDLLTAKLIPDLLRDTGRRGDPVRFWSAASSIGAEAYTVAMVAAEAIGLNGRSFSVVGTDINSEVLKAAEMAIYPLAMADPIPEPIRKRYLMFARDAGRQEFRIVPELRRKAAFERLNLMDESYPQSRNYDFIFCRNVLIYFPKPIQKAVIGRLLRHLRVGGHLLLGHSETMSGDAPSELRQIAASVFQKTR